jgi:hypothetical protein
VTSMIMEYYGGSIRLENLGGAGGMKATLQLPLLPANDATHAA